MSTQVLHLNNIGDVQITPSSETRKLFAVSLCHLNARIFPLKLPVAPHKSRQKFPTTICSFLHLQNSIALVFILLLLLSFLEKQCLSHINHLLFELGLPFDLVFAWSTMYVYDLDIPALQWALPSLMLLSGHTGHVPAIFYPLWAIKATSFTTCHCKLCCYLCNWSSRNSTNFTFQLLHPFHFQASVSGCTVKVLNHQQSLPAFIQVLHTSCFHLGQHVLISVMLVHLMTCSRVTQCPKQTHHKMVVEIPYRQRNLHQKGSPTHLYTHEMWCKKPLSWFLWLAPLFHPHLGLQFWLTFHLCNHLPSQHHQLIWVCQLPALQQMLEWQHPQHLLVCITCHFLILYKESGFALSTHRLSHLT